MRLEISPQRKRSEDSDEDEPCAISGRWTFQRDSKRWSRLDQLDLDVFTSSAEDAISAPYFISSQDQPFSGRHLNRERVSASAESVLTDLSEQPEVVSLRSAGSGHGRSHCITVPSSPANTNSNLPTASTTRANSVASVCSSGTSGGNEDSFSEGVPSPLDHRTFAFDARTFSGSTGDSTSTRSRAKSFLKRMESLRLRSSSMSSKRKKKVTVSNGRLEISGPVLKEGLDEDKLRQLNCVDIATMERSGTHSRSVSYSTQTSSGSTGSSNSETSSGSAVSTPSPITRARSHSTAAGSLKRVGMYLEGFDPFSLAQDSENLESQNCEKKAEQSMTTENNLRNRKRTDERELERKRIEEESGVIYFYLPNGHKPGTFPKSLADQDPFHRSDSRPHRRSSTSLDSRLSFYDNVPYEIGGGEEDETETGDMKPKIEDVLERVTGLQRLVSTWTESGPGEEEEEEEEGDSDSALDSASPCPSSPLQNRLMETENGSDQESTGNPLGEQDDSVSARERRDSGVGASLSRTNRPQKLRWPSFQNSHRPSVSSSSLQLNCQAVPKFMKRMKVRDPKERSVFGVPLQMNVQRSGQPLPQGIQQAMRYLRNHGLDQVGLFRKSGVKSRIQALRQMNETSGVEGGGVIIPMEQRLQAARAAVCLLPDDNRTALHTLLCFLSDVAANVSDNQMTCTNLAVCLAPSLFHLNTARRDASSPRVMSRKNTLGKPDQRDLNENLAATHCLTHMIQECRKLFQIPEELSRCRNSYIEQALIPPHMEDLLDDSHSYRRLIKDSMDALLKEVKEKFKGYDTCSTHEQAELAYKKVHDGWSLRQWKVCVDVTAGAEEVLQRIVREQERWDEDLLESRVIETLDSNTDIYQYVRDNMAPDPATDYVVLRSWVTDLPKGACACVCASVEHEAAPVLGVRANVMISRYLIEPSGPNKSRVTHIFRVDRRGRCPEWYNKLYGHLCISELVRLRDSFTCVLDK
ncbi:Rho GTPase-activating protein 7 [Bagarius yarrelli]|uniref:Rho GTPase-activating protein 7 n=1 Tax=Bagarius yarrelli TaxID=175774 RepID=A0A556U8D2_BAGYA|nr:Rho GTPase-activating protein 7 [Bagarius yarrelli]